jgi:hypothetical protein
VRRGNSLNKISAGGLKTAALMSRRFLFVREFLMHSKMHYELSENHVADQYRKAKSSPLRQQWHMVVPLHGTSSGHRGFASLENSPKLIEPKSVDDER